MQSDLVYDVGMHRGEDTAYYLAKGYRVVGIEADPELAESCRRRFARPLAEERVVILEGAVVEPGRSRSAAVPFFQNASHSDWGTTNPIWRRRNELLGAPSQVLQVAPLDFREVLERHGHPYYIKIDIEGSDILCLKALLSFPDRPRYLSLESDWCSVPRLADEVRTLWSLGYRQFQVIQQADIHSQQQVWYDRVGAPVSYTFERGSSGPFGADLRGTWHRLPTLLAIYSKRVALDRLLAEQPDRRRSARVRALRARFETHWGSLGWHDTHAKL